METGSSVLIVDDSRLVRWVLKRLLSEDFAECDEAKDGPEAIAAVERRLREQRPYGLICLDLHIPQVHGIEVLEHLRQVEARCGEGRRTPVIVLTSDDDEEVVKKAVLAGADAYLLKPVDRALLTDCLDRLGARPARDRGETDGKIAADQTADSGS